MRPTTLQDRRPGTSADVPDVPSRTSMTMPFTANTSLASLKKEVNHGETIGDRPNGLNANFSSEKSGYKNRKHGNTALVR